MGLPVAPLHVPGAAAHRDRDRRPEAHRAGEQGAMVAGLVSPKRHNKILQMLSLPPCSLNESRPVH